MDLKKVFGAVLKVKRKERDISQEQLALRSGLDRTYLSKLERDIHLPTLTSLFAIAEVLECKPSELVASVEKELANEPNGSNQ